MSGEMILSCKICGTQVAADDELCSQCREMEGKVQVLTREEKRQFSGITLEQDQHQETGHYEEYKANSGRQQIYVKHFNIGNTSMFTKLLLGAILAIVIFIALPLAIFVLSVIGLIYYLMRR